MHINTKKITKWADKMHELHENAPGTHNDWCRALSYYLGEEGQDHPSDDAIRIANELLANPKPIVEFFHQESKIDSELDRIRGRIRTLRTELTKLQNRHRSLTGKTYY